MRDWDDSWYDDDEFPPTRNRRGRAGIIFVAVISFVMAAVNALSSMCFFFCSLIFGGGLQNPPNLLPNQIMQNPGLFLLAIGLLSIAAFVTQLVSAIGMLNSRRWARLLSFYPATYSAGLTGLLIYWILTSLDAHWDEDKIFQVVMWVVGIVLHGGYAVSVFIVMLSARSTSSLR